MTYFYPGHPYYDDVGHRLARKTGRLISEPLNKDGGRSWQVIAQPTVEPVTADEVKLFGRVDTTEEDSMIEGFITAARMAAEEYLGRAFIQQTIKTILDYWPGNVFELPRPPLISIDKIAALDEDDSETVYNSDNYYVITTSEPGKVTIKRGTASPINTSRDYGRFIIQSKHGYGSSASDVPQLIRDAIKVWAMSIYENRMMDVKNPPPDAKKMLDLFRIPGRVSIR